MPAGLYIDLNDGGPPLIITAGMRGLIHAGDIPASGFGSSLAYNLPNLNPSLPTYMLPRETFAFDGDEMHARLCYLRGFTMSGTSFRQTVKTENGARGRRFAASVWQVDQSSPKSGLMISNSSDFTSIGAAKALGFCIFRGDVTISGSWRPSIPAGATGVAVFVKFNDSTKTLRWNGSVITCVSNNNTAPSSQKVNAKIVIFAAGIEPVPLQGGLNMWNSSGECTFSSRYRPFITYGATVPIRRAAADTGGGLVQIGTFGAYFFGQDSSNYCWYKHLGVTMSGNTVRLGRAESFLQGGGWYASDTEYYYAETFNVPVIPDIY